MAILTRRDIVAELGPVDEVLLSDLLKTDASPAELAEAQAWLGNDDALLNEGRRLPAGRVGELVEILRAHELTDEDDAPAA